MLTELLEHITLIVYHLINVSMGNLVNFLSVNCKLHSASFQIHIISMLSAWDLNPDSFYTVSWCWKLSKLESELSYPCGDMLKTIPERMVQNANISDKTSCD